MMEYKILYPEAFPVVECSLRHGEAIQAESDVMIAMDATVDVEGKMEGGVLGGRAQGQVAGGGQALDADLVPDVGEEPGHLPVGVEEGDVAALTCRVPHGVHAVD